MNSDKFDRVVLDLLYGELDELTSAAAKRHMDQSARAREIYAHFKATRQLSVLPKHAPPADFEATLMARERGALAELPMYHRIGRIISMLAGYAMRPQLIMGALLLLMIGSSLMFLRARPGQHSAVQVTERGAPEADGDLVLPLAAAPPNPPQPRAQGGFQAANTPAAEPSSPLEPETGKKTNSAVSAPLPPARGVAAESADPSNEGLDPFDQAVRMYRAGQYVEAQRRFERISRSGGRRAAEAALYSAQSVRNASGCALAVSRFDRVRLRFPGSGSAYEAAWRAAKCLQQLGDVEAARQNYESLLQVASHAERARVALAALGGGEPAAAYPEGVEPGAGSGEAAPGKRAADPPTSETLETADPEAPSSEPPAAGSPRMSGAAGTDASTPVPP
jgi:TolA-binding protein